MEDLLKNIVNITKRLKNESYTNTFSINGTLHNLNESDIDSILIIYDFIDDLYLEENNKIVIEKDNLKDFLNKNIKIDIKIGDIPNFYFSVKDFINGNKFSLNNNIFYIKEINYLNDNISELPELIKNYHSNINLINLLIEISDFKNIKGNILELFFYKSEKGLTLPIDYNIQDLENFAIFKLNELEEQLIHSPNHSEKKQMFTLEMINQLNKSSITYSSLLTNWNTIIENYKKSFNLYLSGFSFDKIKTSSIEHFQKLVDKIYETISKVSSYLFGIPIGYILIINNFDYKGENLLKNLFLLILSIIFYIIIRFVFIKNIEESINAIEDDISKFKKLISNNIYLKDVYKDLESIEQKKITKQYLKLDIIKYISLVVLLIVMFSFCSIYYQELNNLINSLIDKIETSKSSFSH